MDFKVPDFYMVFCQYRGITQWCFGCSVLAFSDWLILPDRKQHDSQQTAASPTEPRVHHWAAYLGPGADSPLGGAGVTVAGPPGLRPVVIAVLVVDDPRAVVVQRLDAADRAHLHPRLAAGLAAVLPLVRHPAGGEERRTRT